MKLIKNIFFVAAAAMLAVSCEQGIDPITPVAPGSDASSPVVTVKLPTENYEIKTGELVSPVKIDFEVTDDIELGNVAVKFDGVDIKTYSSANYKDYRRLIDTLVYDNVTMGNHTISIVAADLAGKTTTKTIAISKVPPYSPKYDGEVFYMPFEGDYMEMISFKAATVTGTPGFADDGLQNTKAYKGAADSYLTYPISSFKGSEFTVGLWVNLNASPDRSGILTVGATPDNRNNGFRLVDGLYRPTVQHPGPDPLLEQQIGRVQGRFDHLPHRDDGAIVPVAQDVGEPRPEFRRGQAVRGSRSDSAARATGATGAALGVDRGYRGSAQSHVGWLSAARQIFGYRGRGDGVAGEEDFQIGEGSHHGDVVQGVVGAAQGAVAHAARYPHDLDVRSGVGHVDLDLVQASRRVKARGPADENRFAAARKPRGYADRVLLRDADFDELFRQRRLEIAHGGRAFGIRDHREDALVFSRRRKKGGRKRLPAASTRLAHRAPPSTSG